MDWKSLVKIEIFEYFGFYIISRIYYINYNNILYYILYIRIYIREYII